MHMDMAAQTKFTEEGDNIVEARTQLEQILENADSGEIEVSHNYKKFINDMAYSEFGDIY